MVLVSRYFLVHYWCGSIALLHQLTERFYLGKPLQRFNFSILIAIYTLALLGGIWLQPTIKRLHSIKYGRADLYSTVQKTQAAKAFAAWSGLAQALNFLITVGVGTYLWRVANPVDTPRFVPSGKFRS